MGEPTCLMRSFSHPSNASREAKEGDPLRALTESISFGRFMSESLAWEKWSTFSHNHYLEEVEQFSKPGSVAQKRAYFEAHYKKRAAMKAAALLEQANAEVYNAPQVEIAVSNVPEVETAEETHNDCPMDSVSAEATSDVVVNIQQEKGVLELAHSADANACYPNGENDNLQNASVERAEEFFQKLEEKNNAKEAEKTHLQVKSKIPLTRPRSPKLGRKPSSNMVQETNFQVPRRPSVNAESSKRIVPKVNQSTTRSVTLPTKKKAHENASPNIQR
ncbi:hypothetical protein GH714_028932 [Hevea brasiliensis]|uniref:TPX2 C-terminal domain-containing protein n=1 Tax=Hevea brasiliensis TaxID=3981 RepID=A0A6A6LL86_HEVBR|nr:hypothetical protein GH714_028932 [Hevea brasiliensis]